LTRPQWNPMEMLPFIIMLAFGGKQLDPWLRRLIELIEGTQNSVTKMQKGLHTFHQGIFQLILPPQSNTPQAGPGAEQNTETSADDQPMAEQVSHNAPDNANSEQPWEINQPGTSIENAGNHPTPGDQQITTSTNTTPSPSVLPVELPEKLDDDTGKTK